jgi:hypothetical protein
LLGSHTIRTSCIPLANTVADVIDRSEDGCKHTDANYTYVIGSIVEYSATSNQQAPIKHTHLELDYTYNADDDPNRFYYSPIITISQRMAFPLFSFSGVHEDYHRPTDTPDKTHV